MIALFLVLLSGAETIEREFTCELCKASATKAFSESLFGPVDYVKLLNPRCQSATGIPADACKAVLEALPKIIASKSSPTSGCAQANLCPRLPPRSPSSLSNSNSLSECQEGKDAVESAFSLIDSGASDDHIRETLMDACKSLTGETQSSCKSMASNGIQSLKTLHLKNTDPLSTAKSLHLCPDEPECLLCNAIISHSERLLFSNLSANHLVDGTRRVFGKSASIVLSDHIHDLFNGIHTSLSDSQICFKSGLCSQRQPSSLLPPPIKGRAIPCETCHQVIRATSSLLNGNYSEEHINHVLNSACSKLPKKYSHFCLEAITYYIPTVVDTLSYGLSESRVCERIGLCKSLPIPMPPSVPNPTTCTSCKTLISTLSPSLSLKSHQNSKNSVGNNQVLRGTNQDSMGNKQDSEQYNQLLSDINQDSEISMDLKIEKLSEKCHLMQKPMDQACHELTTDYKELLKETIQRQENPATACESFGLCSPSLDDIKARYPHLEGPSLKASPLICDVCRTISIAVESISQTSITSGTIAALCSSLPPEGATLCESLGDSIADKALSLFDRGLNATSACIKMRLCKPSSEKPSYPKVDPKDEPATCKACRSSLSHFEDSIRMKRNPEEISKVMKRVCSKLPSQGSAEGICNKLITEYNQVVTDWLSVGISSLEVCTSLNLCHGRSRSPVPMDLSLDFPNPDSCQMCLSPPSSCVSLPSQPSQSGEGLRDICEVLKRDYNQTIEDGFKEGLDRKTICSVLGLCPRTSQLTKVVMVSQKVKSDKMCLDVVASIRDGEKVECGGYSGELNRVCERMKRDYQEVIQNSLQEDLDDASICDLLGLSSQKGEFESSSPVISSSEICMKFFDWMRVSSREYSGEKLLSLLNSHCRRKNRFIQRACKIPNVENVHSLIDLLFEVIEPARVCRFLDFD